MKRYIALALALVLTFSLYACNRPQENGMTQIGNPVVEVNGIEGMREKLYFWIDAPEGAENVRYSVISDLIGQVHFTLDGTEYCFRASEQMEDISGVYGPFEETVNQIIIEHPIGNCGVQIHYTTEGGAVASWMINRLSYALSATNLSDRDAFSNLVRKLVTDELDRTQEAREQAEIEKWTGLEGHVKIVSSGEICTPFVTVAYGADGDISYDCPLVEPEEAKQAGALPCVPYGVDFEVRFTDGGKLSHVIVYDGEYNRLADRWNLDFSDLPSGTYFVNIIMSESSSGGDYTGYQCVFELIVP